jgi:hypothetical protein
MSWALNMQQTTLPDEDNIPAGTLAFYRDVIETLNSAPLPYLVGGAYALNHYTKISRHTEDFDIFVARADYDRISEALSSAGYETELTFPHWLGKVRSGGDTIDLVFSSGNGIAEVDEVWFEHADSAELFGLPTKVCPAEETIWSKAFIMERERFDGADVAHLLLAQGHQLDWPRLLHRFDPHWRLLLSHLTLFGFIYPTHREVIPRWVMDELMERLKNEVHSPSPEGEVCGGTLLSREQYLNDVNLWGYEDARVTPHGNMTEQEAVHWTEAIKHKKH